MAFALILSGLLFTPAATAEACDSITQAAAEGDVSCVDRLLKSGASPNANGKEYWGPLQAAAAGNKVEIIDFLIARGASLEDRDLLGRTALWIAAKTEPRRHCSDCFR